MFFTVYFKSSSRFICWFAFQSSLLNQDQESSLHRRLHNGIKLQEFAVNIIIFSYYSPVCMTQELRIV